MSSKFGRCWFRFWKKIKLLCFKQTTETCTLTNCLESNFIMYLPLPTPSRLYYCVVNKALDQEVLNRALPPLAYFPLHQMQRKWVFLIYSCFCLLEEVREREREIERVCAKCLLQLFCQRHFLFFLDFIFIIIIISISIIVIIIIIIIFKKNKKELKQEWTRFRSLFSQPLPEIRAYFGEKIALYFAFLGLVFFFVKPFLFF